MQRNMIVTPVEETCINVVRCVSAALPQAAKSGHPGAPMGCAAIAHVLWGHVMKYSARHTTWIARDRFVLSNGHGCALQYTMLHLVGYDMTIDDLKKFRQLHSKTPGHPECATTRGIEVTTGPLGQGIAQAVGLAIAGEMMANAYNRDQFPLFNNYVYTVVGDGCLQEGIASEACSLAGHLGLSHLIAFYDNNHISIDGNTQLSFTEDVAMRFKAYGWNVLHVPEASVNAQGVLEAIQLAKQSNKKPTLIICDTLIGYGSKWEATERVHGAPLGVDEILRLRATWGLPHGETDMFQIPDHVYAFYHDASSKAASAYEEWTRLFEKYAQHYPQEHKQLFEQLSGQLPDINWDTDVPQYTEASPPLSTRALSGQVLNALVDKIPTIVGGSADLTTSNCTALKNVSDFTQSCRSGKYIRYGVREHAMVAISNGLCAFGGLRPFAATFLNFITYAWGAVRLTALSQLPVLFIATHDSIGLGEDGPTHQPIEVSALCRALPNLNYFRPADGREVVACYRTWLSQSTRPTVAALSRSNLPHIKGSSSEKALKGGYVISDFQNNGLPKAILASCGSELHICVTAADRLKAVCDVRVVSIPCWELFREQPHTYQESVLCVPGVKRVWVEAGSPCQYDKFFDSTVTIATFGASAPDKVLQTHFGFTPEHVESVVMGVLNP